MEVEPVVLSEMQGAVGEGNGAGDAAGEGIPDVRKGTTPKRMERITKRLSEHWTSWIVDEDDDEDGEEQGDESGGPTDGEVEDDEEMVKVTEPEEAMESCRSVASQGRGVFISSSV